MRTHYLVLDNNSRPMVLCAYEDGTVCAIGDDATLFETYEEARSALRRTRRYEKRHRLQWFANEYRIMRARTITL